ncbi:DUF2878 family protein [uncultured Thiothrix sp.]|uniref:DUF2878 family protein n=1 Tax=uncultured Thiothrix sp. TaxID=223185 RepID=UPI002639E85C|nr:DUF2878 family protein [uncultured Thiothrix sp.]
MNTRPYVWIDALWFQALWWLIALQRDQAGLPILALLLLHLMLFPQRRLALISALLLAPLGYLTDVVWVQSQLLSFNSAYRVPLWMLGLWVGVIWSLSWSLHWLKHLAIYWQALIGALGAASSYYAAAQLGALQFETTLWNSLFWITVMWALLLPSLMYAMTYLERRFMDVQTSIS